MGGEAETFAYVRLGDETLTDDFALTGWMNWDAPEIAFTVDETAQVAVGVSVKAAPGAWGTMDDFSLGLR